MKKVFISYSHIDDIYRKELEVHLSAMRRNGELSSWSDRKIVPGQEWGREIDMSLYDADIIIFLVSANFIDSDYCFDIEVKAALSLHEKGMCVVVPVIIRPCDWSGCPFSKLQALPVDTRPVSKWEDRDEGWLSVIQGIKRATNIALNEKKVGISEDILPMALEIKDEFLSWLEDTEIQLTHRRVNKIALSDIYAWPDFRNPSEDFDRVSKAVSSSIVFKENVNYLIFGDEQAGKTALSKMLFVEFYRLGYVPIHLSGYEINTANIDRLIKGALEKQYSGENKFIEISDRAILILDDFTNIRLSDKLREELIRGAKTAFKKLLVVSESSFRFIAPEYASLEGFSYLEMLPFGNVKRQELIENWVSLGIEEQITDEALCRETDEVKMKVDALVKRNIIPPKPIFVLSILQLAEAYTPQKFDLTSYGHCYQYLVYQALERASIKKDEIDKYLNVMTELAWAQVNKDGNGFNADELELFFVEYHKRFLKVDRDRVIARLINSKILASDNGVVRFKYPYIYYFFAAKRLSETIKDEEVKIKIRGLLENLHREEAGNIIVFITHHTKDGWILDEIQVALMGLFEDKTPASLNAGSLAFMEEFLKKIPKLVMEKREVQNERKRRNRELDEFDHKSAEVDRHLERIDPADVLARVNRVFKGMEIIGQIVRNRSASMDRSALLEIVEQAYSVGLRFLQFFIELSDSSKTETIKVIEAALKENPSITNADVEKEAKNIFLLLSYGVIYGVINKMASSIGSKEAEEIYEEIENKFGSPAVKLIGQSISLKFHKRLDFNAIQLLARDFSANPTCERILKEIIVQHTYMFPVDYKDKQRLSEVLSLSVRGQRQMDLQKDLKI